jgi:5-methylcytosine-specific restriction endonuclease McrA
MALTRSYEPSIYGKVNKKSRLKKAVAAKKTLSKMLLSDKAVQAIVQKELAKIKARQTKQYTKWLPYVAGMKGADFCKTREWAELRYKTLAKYGAICQCCGADKVILHVDHIKPRSKYPQLELDINNLQVLCETCNVGKSNKDVTDWR